MKFSEPALLFLGSFLGALFIIALHKLHQRYLTADYFPISVLLGVGGRPSARGLLAKLLIPFSGGMVIAAFFGNYGPVVAGYAGLLAAFFLAAPNILVPELLEETDLAYRKRELYFLYAVAALAYGACGYFAVLGIPRKRRKMNSPGRPGRAARSHGLAV